MQSLKCCALCFSLQLFLMTLKQQLHRLQLKKTCTKCFHIDLRTEYSSGSFLITRKQKCMKNLIVELKF